MMNAITGSFATQFLSKPDVGGRHYDVIYKRKSDGDNFCREREKDAIWQVYSSGLSWLAIIYTLTQSK